MAVLVDDGGGYDLAGKLESEGGWRRWLRESSHASFLRFLSSPSSWDAFMRSHHSLRLAFAWRLSVLSIGGSKMVIETSLSKLKCIFKKCRTNCRHSNRDALWVPQQISQTNAFADAADVQLSEFGISAAAASGNVAKVAGKRRHRLQHSDKFRRLELTWILTRHPQIQQMRQQQIAAMSNLLLQPSNQFRQMSSLQAPQVQTQWDRG